MASHCFSCDCEFWIAKRRHHCRWAFTLLSLHLKTLKNKSLWRLDELSGGLGTRHAGDPCSLLLHVQMLLKTN